MKILLEINTRDEAVEALELLNKYVGNVSVAASKTAMNEANENEGEANDGGPNFEAEEKPVRKTRTRKAAPKKEEKVEDDSEDEDDAEVEETKPKRTTRAKKAATPKIDAKSLTAKAKEAISFSSKDEVKDVISEYGARISAVDEADYEALDAALQEIIDSGDEV